jgi:hypothetical protein
MKLLDIPSSVIERDDPSGIKASRAIVASDCVAGASGVETEPPLGRGTDKILYHYFLLDGLICLSKN